MTRTKRLQSSRAERGISDVWSPMHFIGPAQHSNTCFSIFLAPFFVSLPSVNYLQLANLFLRQIKKARKPSLIRQSVNAPKKPLQPQKISFPFHID